MTHHVEIISDLKDQITKIENKVKSQAKDDTLETTNFNSIMDSIREASIEIQNSLRLLT
jgi:chorismate mutase